FISRLFNVFLKWASGLVSTTVRIKLEFLPCGCIRPPPCQVTVYIHVCPDSYVAMTADNTSNMDVAAKKPQTLNCGCFTHIFNLAAQKICTISTVSFDLQPPNSHQFILGSKWMFVPTLRKFPLGLLKLMHL
ncbi:hypothetical protein P3447_27645, partial [Vibrio parahaemolyticus]|nr:hypothetical protein [Vibrio parahaemolyticus]